MIYVYPANTPLCGRDKTETLEGLIKTVWWWQQLEEKRETEGESGVEGNKLV